MYIYIERERERERANEKEGEKEEKRGWVFITILCLWEFCSLPNIAFTHDSYWLNIVFPRLLQDWTQVFN